jgi:hypothetical protein
VKYTMFLFNFMFWVSGLMLMAVRDEEYLSRGSTFGDFVTILTERLMQDITVERSRVIFTAIAITRKIVLQCYCEHRVVCTLYSFSTRVIR